MARSDSRSEVDQKIEDEAENEDLDDTDVLYEINTYGTDFPVDGLVSRFEREDIYQPNFQRNFVWTHKQASKFIESILLGLPIPSVFFYREEGTRRHIIIDGLQRLTTLHAFRKGVYPGTDKEFALRYVRNDFKNHTYESLNHEHQRRFEDATIHAIIIQQFAPDDNKSSVYHIFERLNSSGTPLSSQEMRTAIYHGKFQELLEDMNTNEHWREIYGLKDKRAKDHELILRFLALANNRSKYRKPMKEFLNNFMFKHRNLSDSSAKKFRKQFYDTIEKVYDAVGKRAFRPRSAMNVAVYDAIMIAIFESKISDVDVIISCYKGLMSDKKFIEFCSAGTTDEASVENRIKMAKERFSAS